MLISIIFAYILCINLLTFIIYGIDKRRAIKQRFRISEATLLILALIGGSVGALLGMPLWHHKTRHLRFSIGIPCILLLQVLGIGLLAQL